jgi:predicted Zn-dependent protease
VRIALLGLGVVLLSFTTSRTSLGYCRTTTCEPTYRCDEYPDDCCIRDEKTGCDTNGVPIAWPTSCVSYAIQKDGSSKENISAAELSSLVDQAFDTWLDTSCPNGISLTVENYGEVDCRLSEFNTKLANANIWMFRDSGWSTGDPSQGGDGFDSSALAVTTTNFHTKSGQLFDADVELNSDRVDFTLPGETTNFDLLSILTHEAGHFLGLDHSPHSEATMYYAYNPPSIEARSLDTDDEQGFCAAYPEDREIPNGSSCDPRRGFTKECKYDADPPKGACSFRPGPSPNSSMPGLAALALGAMAWTMRRSRANSNRAST